MITGKCYCGAISYELQSAPVKSGICTCQDCQRLTGGTAWPFMAVLKEALLIHGTVKEFTRSAASGKHIHVGFCDTCGSTVFGRPERWPHLTIVGASSLDDKSLFYPEVQVWSSEAPEWMPFLSAVPQFDKDAS